MMSSWKIVRIAAAMALVACGSEPAQQMLAPNAEIVARSQSNDGDSEDDSDSDSDSDDPGPRFSAWSAPVNLGSLVNSPSEDLAPFISKDGQSLYFNSPRPGVGMGAMDLWVSHRPSKNAPWEPAQNLGSVINGAGAVNDNAPSLSGNGRLLFFGSNRSGSFGSQDIYVSQRRNRRAPWETPVNLGSAVNTSTNEGGAAYFKDDATGTITLYFHSTRADGLGGNDIYASTLGPDGTFGSPLLIRELSSASDDQRPAIRRDGLEMFLASNRSGTLGQQDIWVATRASTSEPWSAPIHLGPGVNTVNAEGGPALSFDGTALYFSSANRPGTVGDEGRFDIWVATRVKLKKTD